MLLIDAEFNRRFVNLTVLGEKKEMTRPVCG
jgi:hypothetical protein